MYKIEIEQLINRLPFEVDTSVMVTGSPPTMASSEFLTNREQGDWAERVVLRAINESSSDYFAVDYGRKDVISAGDPGFAEFYKKYQEELNLVGKKPDILIFRKKDFPDMDVMLSNDNHIAQAVAALEVRSSSFLEGKYRAYMEKRQADAVDACEDLRKTILCEPFSSLLRNKSKAIFELLSNANVDIFRDLDFRLPSWSSTTQLVQLRELLSQLKTNIKILHSRDYLSITPKVEDFALVNRWIQNYNVRHYYLQVFFDKAFVISFRNILKLVANDEHEEKHFSIERDVKNQGKSTVKVDVRVGNEILGR
ncbi:MAG: AccI family restriction endonuclease, partial [Sedimentisphaerales bacterium]|nr:AccI family restriction endonuclease [Sedimentisphaerales bacterium]